MAYIVMAYIVVAYIVMAYTVMAYTVDRYTKVGVHTSYHHADASYFVYLLVRLHSHRSQQAITPPRFLTDCPATSLSIYAGTRVFCLHDLTMTVSAIMLSMTV